MIIICHYHLYICIITGSQEESVAAELEAAEEAPQEELEHVAESPDLTRFQGHLSSTRH
jgi:hypothetical protein